MIKLLLIVAALLDVALAGLLVAVSGFLFGAGPESMHGGGWMTAAYAAAILACLGAPIAGFIMNGRKRAGLGLAMAFTPLAGALVASMMPAPY